MSSSAPSFTFTYAAVKPGAFVHADTIVSEAKAAGFTVRAIQPRKLTRELAETFYEEHVGKPFFEGLIQHMISGPIVALVLTRPASEEKTAWQAWRDFIGPTNVQKARDEAPTSIRARFGGDGTGNNAVHGSDSTESAAREVGLVFPHLMQTNGLALTHPLGGLTEILSPPRAALIVRADAPDGLVFAAVSALRAQRLCSIRAVSVGLTREEEEIAAEALATAAVADPYGIIAALAGVLMRAPRPSEAYAADPTAAVTVVVVAPRLVPGTAVAVPLGVGSGDDLAGLTTAALTAAVAPNAPPSTPESVAAAVAAAIISVGRVGTHTASLATEWCAAVPLTPSVEAALLRGSTVSDVPCSALTMSDADYLAAHPEVPAAAEAALRATIGSRSTAALAMMAAVLARAAAMEAADAHPRLLGRWARARDGRVTRYTFVDSHNVALDRGDGVPILCTYAIDTRTYPYAMDIVLPLPAGADAAAAAATGGGVGLKCIFEIVDCVLRWEGSAGGGRPAAFGEHAVELIKEDAGWPCAL